MEAPQNPPPKRKRIVVCRGMYCNIDRRGQHFYERLEEALMAEYGENYRDVIRLETANCMSMCGMGPNIAIFPSTGLFCEMNDEKLDDLIAKHVKKPEPDAQS